MFNGASKTTQSHQIWCFMNNAVPNLMYIIHHTNDQTQNILLCFINMQRKFE